MNLIIYILADFIGFMFLLLGAVEFGKATVTISSGDGAFIPIIEISQKNLPRGSYWLNVEVNIRDCGGRLKPLKINGKKLKRTVLVDTDEWLDTKTIIFCQGEKDMRKFYEEIIHNKIQYYYLFSLSNQSLHFYLRKKKRKSNHYTLSTIVPTDSTIRVFVKKTAELEGE